MKIIIKKEGKMEKYNGNDNSGKPKSNYLEKINKLD